LGDDTSPIIGFPEEKVNDTSDRIGRAGSTGKPPLRRRVTGEIPPNMVPQPSVGSRSGVLSPLNPKARAPSGLTGLMGAGSSGNLPSNLNPAAMALGQAQKQRRPLEPPRK